MVTASKAAVIAMAKVERWGGAIHAEWIKNLL